MSRCVIEFNDTGIELADQEGTQRVSPGYAFCLAREMLVGEPAAARIRTNPRAGYDRFWSQLDQERLPTAAGPARSHADLAWFHLNDLWTPFREQYDQALFAVTADYDAENLSILLGIARACEMPVRSVVAASVAAALRHPEVLAAHQELLVLDVLLHRMNIEHLRVDGGRAGLGDRHRTVSHGLTRLYDRWSQMVAEKFLRQTRYDPLHSAASEQQLYDRLPEWLQELAGRARVRAALTSGDHEFSVELTREQFSDVAQPLYQPLLDIAAEGGMPILLRHRMGLMPGLRERLAEHAEVHLLAKDAVPATLLDQARILADTAGGEEVEYHASLPLEAGQAEAPDAEDAAAEQAATHISDGRHLWALPGDIIYLPEGGPPTAEGGDSITRLRQKQNGRIRLLAGSGEPVSVNGEQVKVERDVEAGDRVTVGQHQYTLLRLSEPGME